MNLAAGIGERLRKEGDLEPELNPQLEDFDESDRDSDTGDSEDGSCPESGGEEAHRSTPFACKFLRRTHDSRRRVTGMLFGTVGETVFGGEVAAYKAHYCTRAASQTLKVMRSFAFGDIVRSATDATSFAVVARVVYVAREEPKQGRKLLFLRERLSPPTGALPAFFPGGWADWERVPCNAMERGSSENLLATDELLQIKMVSWPIACIDKRKLLHST